MRQKTKVAREMYVTCRRAWKDGSKIEIDFVSVNGTTSETYTVTIWLKAHTHSDICTCEGFNRRAHCAHIDHFRLVEKLRYAVTSQEVIPAPTKAVLVEAIVFAINKKIGKPVVKIGCDDWMLENSKIRERIFLADPLVEVMLSQFEEKPAEKEVIPNREVATLNYRNEGFNLLKVAPKRKIA